MLQRQSYYSMQTYKINMLFTLNLHSVTCQRYYNKVNKSIRGVGVDRNEKMDEVRVLEHSKILRSERESHKRHREGV